ncbi:hemolysin family protein [Geomonas sp. RF6]|uniref:hemolysin family protein n=1 Tax=Geomonas sp. RF6 TaxID=2897342 RepID=UPI001E41BDFD|nr:hemolysin family protein [Geomonas sp. RF6]UFS70965.1 hemolysin family protein [Geomonas sp. RF6]
MFVTVLYILVVFLLVAANGFFVTSEFAIVAVRRSRIALLAEEGDRRAVVLLELLDNLSAYISATQLGITMASLALGWIGEPAFADLLEAPLKGRVSETVLETIAFAVAFTTITCLHIVLGELAPKTLALERTEKMALAIARPMRLFHTVFRWPVRLLDWAGTQTVRLFGLHPSPGHDSVYTSDELRHLIDASRQSGSIEPDEQRLLHGVFEFSDAEVREVMVPRGEVDALPVTASLEEAKEAFRTLGYSRMPVYRHQLDSIVGVVYRRDLEPYLERPDPKDFNLEKLVHRPKYIPANAQLSTALRQMQSSHIHLAMVVDEYGGVEGIVTLEDLLEEIVGEIADEFDEESTKVEAGEDGSYVMDGMLTVRALNSRLQLHLPEDASYTTVAGFLLAQAGHLMNVGESVEHKDGRFTVESLERHRIGRVRFTPAPDSEAGHPRKR